jgi:CIC family chloride channel protein
MIGAIGLFWPHIFGVGYESINKALHGELVWSLMGVLILIKLAATAMTIGSGHSGGIFTPSLFMGAMTGGFFGYHLHSLFPAYTASSGAYALVAMGAMVAATTHAPITAIIIVFELTGSYSIILPLMSACIISTIVSSSLSRESIYTLKLARRGLSIVAGREVSVMKSLHVREVMTERMRTFYEGTPLTALMDEALSSPYSYFPIVDGKGDMTGIFSLQDLRMLMMEDVSHLGPLVVAKDISTVDGIITVTPDDDLDVVFQKFGQKNIEEIPVVKPENPSRVVGMVRRKDVIEAYNKEILRRSVVGP